MKKRMAIAVLALVLTGLLAGTCFAAVSVVPPWYVCTLEGTGQTTGVTAVILTDLNVSGAAQPAFTKTVFSLGSINPPADPNIVKKMMAAALTGNAATLRVYVQLFAITPGSPISAIYVVSDTF
jgi:hypothetical protein